MVSSFSFFQVLHFFARAQRTLVCFLTTSLNTCIRSSSSSSLLLLLSADNVYRSRKLRNPHSNPQINAVRVQQKRQIPVPEDEILRAHLQNILPSVNTPHTTKPKLPKDYIHPSTDWSQTTIPSFTISGSFGQLFRPLEKLCCSCLVIEITSTWFPIPVANSTI